MRCQQVEAPASLLWGGHLPSSSIGRAERTTTGQRETTCKSPKVTDLFQIAELELGEKTTLGKAIVRAVDFKINAEDPQSSMTGTVWIDLNTHLPLKRVMRFKGVNVEETYVKWELDALTERTTFSRREAHLPQTNTGHGRRVTSRSAGL